MLRHVETNVAEQFLKSRVHCAPPLRARSVLRSFVEFVLVERKTELVNHMHQEPCCCFGTLRGAIFQRKKWSTSKRGSSLSCASGLFEVVLKILFNFPDEPNKNVKCCGFLLLFSRAHIKPNYGRLFPPFIGLDPSMSAYKERSNR